MSKRRTLATEGDPLTSNPFAGLQTQFEVPDGPRTEPPAPAAEPEPEPEPEPRPEPQLGGRLLVRRQKKGRGGKTVTCIEGLSSGALADLVPRLKRELGCSGQADGGVLVAGLGDHLRVAAWLRGLGAARVIVGN